MANTVTEKVVQRKNIVFTADATGNDFTPSRYEGMVRDVVNQISQTSLAIQNSSTILEFRKQISVVAASRIK